jgi:hypothetical protein
MARLLWQCINGKKPAGTQAPFYGSGADPEPEKEVWNIFGSEKPIFTRNCKRLWAVLHNLGRRFLCYARENAMETKRKGFFQRINRKVSI